MIPLAMRTQVHIVSHGPTCLDGVTAAVAVARFYGDRADVDARFASNSEIDAVLQGLRFDPGGDHELWITDISWREPATEQHLRELARQGGVRIYWIDHHRTALERVRAGRVDVPFTDTVLSEEYAASRLTYEYLAGAARSRRPSRCPRSLPSRPSWPWRTTTTAGCTGCRVPASWPGWCGRSAPTRTRISSPSTSTSPTRRAWRLPAARVGEEIARSFAVAEASRVEHTAAGVQVVAAVCAGHPSEIADAWGKQTPGAVFALYDVTGLAVSLRRSPDCDVDLSKVAEALGGGGHAAAAGCELPELRRILAEVIATRVAEHLP